MSTLRKWAMGGSVATYMQETPVGQLRMISLEGIYRRAEQLGREIEGAPPTGSPSPGPAKPAARRERRSPVDPEIPPGTTLVPLDAWNKMLLQLGNLHEAGQQLAEASARAAKAETEAAFLKERLAELRAELASAREQEPPSALRQAEPRTAGQPGPPGVLRQIFRSWLGRGPS